MEEDRLAELERKIEAILVFMHRLEPLIRYAESKLPRRVPRQGGPR